MNKPQIISEEELILVKEYVLLPVILDVLERDIGKMKIADLKVPIIYIGNLKQTQDAVTRELYIIRQELRKRGIKVYEREQTANGIKASYVCRGYRHELSFLPALIRTTVIEKLARLMNERGLLFINTCRRTT
jgi:hypothetical protein